MWSPQVFTRLIVHNEHIRRLHQLLLYARGRNEDMIVALDRDASTSSRHPSVSVEFVA
jgi:hypothetical protein